MRRSNHARRYTSPRRKSSATFPGSGREVEDRTILYNRSSTIRRDTKDLTMESIAVETSDALHAAEPIRRLEENVARVIRGKREVIRLATVCLLARGHVLLEDVPGVGKTTLAQGLARSLGLSFQRIQFTSDLLPSDIIGVTIYNQKNQTFEFVPGPLFANV